MSKFKYDMYYDDIIRLKNEGKKAREIVEFLNDDRLNVNKIYKILHRLNATTSSSKTFAKTDAIDKKALELLEQGHSHREVARILNIDQQSMTLRLKKKYNIAVLPDGKKEVNSHYFDIIDTPEKAYWLGMMYADGYVDESSNGFELCLKDKEHIEKFKDTLQSKHKINKKTIEKCNNICEAYRINIRDKQIVSSLVKHGCFQSKSYDIQFPTEEQVPKHLMRHFIRGFFDGDGDISLTGNKNGYRIAGFTCANLNFLLELSKVIKSELGIETSPEPTRNHYRLRIQSVTKSYNFLHYIYNESTVHLDRKYELYKNFILPSNTEAV